MGGESPTNALAQAFVKTVAKWEQLQNEPSEQSRQFKDFSG